MIEYSVNGLAVTLLNGHVDGVVENLPQLEKKIAQIILNLDRRLLGPELKFLRDTAGLSVDALSDLMGAQKWLIVSWEAGHVITTRSEELTLRMVAARSIRYKIDVEQTLRRISGQSKTQKLCLQLRTGCWKKALLKEAAK
jgi:DNA-binding transcriptional regulator YiaG